MDIEDFDRAVADGLVHRKEQGPLALYTYSFRCQIERLWTPVTRAARGIVFDRRSGAVVARPFEKFFNLGEVPETQPDALPATPFRVEDKLDGSLAILFQHEGRWTVCTKGSFESDQAIHAQEELLPKYDLSRVPPGLTLLAEMLYPENRVVIDYAGRRELVLLAAIETESGMEQSETERAALGAATGMPLVPIHEFANLLALPFRENAEGYVVRFANGLRVKIKNPWYVRVHRLLELRSPRLILELLERGEYAAIRASLPDDLAVDFDDIAAALRLSLRQYEQQARDAFGRIEHLRGDRKAFAAAAQNALPREQVPLLFALADGKPFERYLYKLVLTGLREERPREETRAGVRPPLDWTAGPEIEPWRNLECEP